jgi:hypothetical protein
LRSGAVWPHADRPLLGVAGSARRSRFARGWGASSGGLGIGCQRAGSAGALTATEWVALRAMVTGTGHCTPQLSGALLSRLNLRRPTCCGAGRSRLAAVTTRPVRSCTPGGPLRHQMVPDGWRYVTLLEPVYAQPRALPAPSGTALRCVAAMCCRLAGSTEQCDHGKYRIERRGASSG